MVDLLRKVASRVGCELALQRMPLVRALVEPDQGHFDFAVLVAGHVLKMLCSSGRTPLGVPRHRGGHPAEVALRDPKPLLAQALSARRGQGCGLHRPGLALEERHYGEIQPQVARPVAQAGMVRHAGRDEGADRSMAAVLRGAPGVQRSGRPATSCASPRRVRHCKHQSGSHRLCGCELRTQVTGCQLHEQLVFLGGVWRNPAAGRDRESGASLTRSVRC
jgi:hypothetical protein